MVLKILIAAIVLAPAVLLVIGAVRGRVRVASCCSVPAEADGRMASAYADDRPAAVTAPPAP